MDGERMRHDGIRNDAAGHGSAKYWHAGASLVEFAVAAIVLAVLAAVFLLRLLDAQEYAEKVAMEATVENMRAGLRAQIGALLIADRTSEIVALVENNPVQWLDVPPEGYLGEYPGQPSADTNGAWYFDSVLGELVYTANLRRHFVPSSTSGYTVRIKVLPISDATTSRSPNEPVWVRLAVLNDYSWF
ncbi:MAG: hypothetical protein JSU95_00800 [Betaproteobacteria bacterium]|nr:MAG: hypothetical protein JSU95_00800 [Betaproteobacteria bacterium]